MMTLAHGIGLPIAAVKGHRTTRIAIENRLATWEHYERMVVHEMPTKGFSEAEVAAALNECYKMIDWYDKLLEQYE